MVVETYLKAALSISIFLIAVSGVAASAPTEAIDPNPVDGAIDVPVDANLSWSRGEGAVQDEVYLGTDPCALPLVAAIMNLPPFPPLYNPPGDLVASTTYYWQIVEVNDPNEYPGPVWSFSTIRGEAQCEYPEDGAVIDGDIAGDNIWTKLIFIPGATAVEHTGYLPFGSTPGWEYTFFAGNPSVPPADETLVRGTVYYWTVDETDAQGNTYPGEIWEFAIQGFKAFAPSPPNEAVDVETIVLLSWLPGFSACHRDVYIGTSWDDVNNAVYDPFNPPPEFLDTVFEPNILVTGLAHEVKYYWRVDEIVSRCPCPPICGGTYYKGDVWSFTTAGGEAQCDYPEDGAVITGNTEYSGDDYIWTRLIFIPGATVVEHTGYFSEDYSKVESRDQDANLGPPPYADVPGWEYTFLAGIPQVPPANDTLVRGTRYYWTVDATDALGNTFAGDIWEFTILGFSASEPSPSDEAVDVETTVLLSWRSGFYDNGHAVFLGTSWEDVNNAVYNPTNQPPELLGNVPEPNILVTGLEFNTKYYWRADECAARCPPPLNCCISYKGDVWCFTTAPNRIYVDIDAAGADNGTNWADAYECLQYALNAARSANKPVEICVAQGIYRPGQCIETIPGADRRVLTFQLINGVTLKGGYAGFGEPNPNARDIQLYETILSGDRLGNDVDVNDPADLLDEPTRGDNSYHVVTGSGTDANAVLDGFTISGGNAEGTNRGGGIYNNNGSPTISNCILSENSAGWGGGGMYNNIESHPTVTNCIFIRNLSYAGGGIYGGYGRIMNCTFTGNSAQNYGGGLAYFEGLISDCIISGNSAGKTGGGFDYAEIYPGVLINCTISANTSGEKGGGIYFEVPTIPPPLGTLGDPSYLSSSMIVITNCTVSGNFTGGDGGGIYIRRGESLVTNCIFWGNMPDQIYGGISMLTYSDVQGGQAGLGNIDADPCFVDAAGGDLRLSSDSPCIDAGYNNAPNLPATDFDGHPRIIDGDCNDTEVVDMGAFEFNYAYMGDFDYNCTVDFVDLSILGLAWTSQPGDFNWDFACNINIPADNVIDKLDLAAFADNWLAEIP
ncbi:MAG: right-handed parallel beta-helix repeat-containing protein [Planctomycetota bacterium]|jgi:hypothetical protein